MTGKMRSSRFVLFIMLLPITEVVAHAEETGPTFDIIDFLLVVLFVSVVVALSLLFLKRFETVPGTFPIRKLAVIALLTIVVNSVVLGYIYRDVIL